MPFLALIWGAITAAWAAVATAASAAVTFVVASRAMTALVIGAVLTFMIMVLPIPEQFNQLPSLVAAIPAPVVWAMGFAEVKFGVTVVFTCLLTRFIYRLLIKVVTS